MKLNTKYKDLKSNKSNNKSNKSNKFNKFKPLSNNLYNNPLFKFNNPPFNKYNTFSNNNPLS
eukprot:CAMPEP_0204821398 /NCGR_PEP_ID=MMETSP1018-20131115/14427_1 /ASSEMBLY_ACC=CAM_ASM_000518 /TAXON_ID=46462 /ORGANISM="Anophryoides haemophila, Strain AH6" /LENGTH=61 /DNA_ID=CAMNT_0051929381 /DNA_START=699 /DNA_END=884 /DNA_ORIENTATION=+